MFWASGALSKHDCMPGNKQKQAQDRNTHFETASLPVAKILRPVPRQAPTKRKACSGKLFVLGGFGRLSGVVWPHHPGKIFRAMFSQFLS